MKITHVGSLPFLDITQALDYSFRYDVPAIPTLPRLDEKQFIAADIIYGLEIGKVSDRRLLLNKDFYKSTKELVPYYLEDFFARFDNSGKDEFKYQCIGPISFYSMLRKEMNVEFKFVYEFLAKKYSQLISKLNDKGKYLFVLDEPLLFEDFKNTYPALESFCEELKRNHSNIAIHCCGKLKISDLNKSLVPMSIDFNLYSENEILELQSEIIPGVTFLNEDPEYLKLFKDKKLKANYVTPSCGLAFKTLDEVDQILNNLEKIKTY